MRKRKRLYGVLLMVAALIIMTLPVSEADAASSASDFVMEGSKLIKYRGTEESVSVPDTVEVIGESAFEGKSKIELVVLPNSVKKIEAYAFWGCDSLDTVVLGKGLTEIGDYAFAGCKGLEQMTLTSNVTAVGAQAFGDCVNMKDITIPKETVQIHESAFMGCAKLKIHCKEGTYADSYAKDFYERQKEMAEYEDVPNYGEDEEDEETDNAIPSPAPSVTSPPYETGAVLGSTQIVGNRAFVFLDAGSMEIKQVQAEESDEKAEAAFTAPTKNEDSIPKYTIVNHKTVADQAYYKDKTLEKVLLPDGIEEIGQFSFARSSLTEIQIPKSVTEISYGAFYHCDSLADVVLPENIQNVEPKAFSKTKWVEHFLQDDSAKDFLVSGDVLIAYRGNSAEVRIPDGIRVIAAEVFQGHTEMEALLLPDSVRVIGEAAFEDCTGLTEVVLNEGLERIKDRAFCGNNAASILVPASVTELGLRALEGADVKFAGEEPKNTYETSATRLSNEAFRDLTEEAGESGVAVVGQQGAIAVLEGSARHYELSILKKQESHSMNLAWERAIDEPLPEDMTVYEAVFSDSSGIPIKKLGHQLLTVTLIVPEELRGKELAAVMLDRNGQLEMLHSERVLLNGEEALSVMTYGVSEFGIYSVGEAESGELQETAIGVQSAASPPAGERTNVSRIKVYIAGVLFLAGTILFLRGRKKRI